ncbi:MAG: hypothetical protein HN368_03395, partial [Spirochaetales bacterium]|nr:hypothetical protein [Spirochaetales bacterium]
VAKNPAPIRPFLDSGFPTASFHSNSAPLPEDRIDEWVSAFTSFVRAMRAIEDVPTDWDRHYLLFQARSFTTILTERVYAIIFLVLTGMLILYPVVRPARFKSYVISIVKNFWALPMMLILVFGLLLVGTLLIEGISSLKRFPGYWTTKPALFFILKISTAVFLFSLMSRYLKRLPFPKRGRFYSAGVLLILVSDIFILGIIDISLAYYVLWATIWAFLFSLTPKRGLKVLCLVISPIWLLKAAFDIFTIPTLEIAELLILSRNTGNLIIAFILFPFLLMLVRLDFMFRHPRKRNKRILLTFTYAILGLGCVGLSTYLSVLTPFSPETPQEIDVREIQDIKKNTSYIKLTSPAALGNITVNTGNQSHEISSSDQTYSIDIPLRKETLDIEVNTSRFLGRVKYTLILNSAGTPSSIRLHMISDEEIIIYDSSFPFSFGKPGSAQIHIGRYPPNPLQIEITLPDAQRGVFEISAEYLDPPYSHDVAGENMAVKHTMMVVQQVAFGEEN